MPPLSMIDPPIFIESICIKDQKIQLLDYHNTRANKCIAVHFPESNKIDLSKQIDPQKASTKLVKCRVVYSDQIESIEYLPYEMRPITSLQIVEIDAQYQYKFKKQNRKGLQYYYHQKKEADDIIMIQNGFVTDSYYANVAFLKNGIWYTPSQPLLEGTKRAYLLDQQNIQCRQIRKEDIQNYESVRLFNAMIDFGAIQIDISKVYQ